ncbi:MAG: EamA family transporter [Myxococcota bacterium]
MGMMAGGDLGLVIATQTGPVSVVTALTGAYPVVTIAFAVIVLKERIRWWQYAFLATVLMGMFLTPG